MFVSVYGYFHLLFRDVRDGSSIKAIVDTGKSDNARLGQRSCGSHDHFPYHTITLPGQS